MLVSGAFPQVRFHNSGFQAPGGKYQDVGKDRQVPADLVIGALVVTSPDIFL